MRSRMPLPRNVSPFASEKLFAAHMRQAARVREFAATATTDRVKARLLEEAARRKNQARQLARDLKPSFVLDPVQPLIALQQLSALRQAGENRARHFDRPL